MKDDKINSNSGRDIDVVIDDCWNKIGSWNDQESRCSKLSVVGHCMNCDVYGNTGRRLLNRSAPEGYLEDWKAFLAAPLSDDVIEYRSFVIFQLADYYFSLPTPCFEQVVDFSRIHALPHKKNKAIMGVVNISNELLPCVSLLEIMGGETMCSCGSDKNSAMNRNIVIKFDDVRWVFPVEKVVSIQRINSELIKASLNHLEVKNTALLDGVFSWQGMQVMCLQEERLRHAVMGLRIT